MLLHVGVSHRECSDPFVLPVAEGQKLAPFLMRTPATAFIFIEPPLTWKEEQILQPGCVPRNRSDAGCGEELGFYCPRSRKHHVSA